MKNKVLIISHNPIGNTDNIGITLRNLFSNFDKDELCELYLRDQACNFDVCENYYCLKETAILKSLVKRQLQTGEVKHKPVNENVVVEHVDQDRTSSFKNSIYELGRKRTQFIYTVRNFVWRHSNWYSKELKEWLAIQKPTVIFFSAGDYSFLFNIVEKIANDLKIPVVIYYMDEYYFVKETKEKFLHIDSRDYKKTFKRLYLKAKANICISDSMSELYTKEFGKEAINIMNSVVVNNETNKYHGFGDIIKVRYFGNISYSRYTVLSKLATVFANLNKEYQRQVDFKVYSGEKNQTTLNEFTSNKDVQFMGRISPEEVSEEITKSDVLVIAEAFNESTICSVKHSISTKIPDSLNSGKVVLAIGPSEVAAINYLRKNNAALVIDDETKIEAECRKLYENYDFSDVLDNAHKLVVLNHDKNLNEEKLREALYENTRD